jgi:glyoxylase-like metal-dependent hydrolase (beta-lactamase superfamily II)
MDWVRASGAPLRAVLNTHCHLDHLGGNAMLRDAATGLRAYAAPARARSRAAAHGRDRLGAVREACGARSLSADRPQQDLTLAGSPLRVGVALGTSGGDLWLLDPASGTLVVGDFVTLPVPFFDTACAERWQRRLRQLAALPFERMVPGQGRR